MDRGGRLASGRGRRRRLAPQESRAPRLAHRDYSRRRGRRARRLQTLGGPQRRTSRTWSFSCLPRSQASRYSGDSCASLTVSPDGRWVTFGAKSVDGKVMIWLRPLHEPSAHPVAGTEGASFPFWSPDSVHLAFFASGKLQKVDLGGAPPLPICDAPNGRSGSWNRDGVILFSPGHEHRDLPGGRLGRPGQTGDGARHRARRNDAPLGNLPSGWESISSTWPAPTARDPSATSTRSIWPLSAPASGRASWMVAPTSPSRRATSSPCVNRFSSRNTSIPNAAA